MQASVFIIVCIKKYLHELLHSWFKHIDDCVRVTALDIQVSLHNQMAKFSGLIVLQPGCLWEHSIEKDITVGLL